MSDKTLVEAVQTRRLHRLLKIANTAPWWHHYFQSQGVKPGQIQALADLARLSPINRFHIIDVPKDDMRTTPQDDSRIVWRKSGGSTTGTPFVWGLSKTATIVRSLAHFVNLLERNALSFEKMSDYRFHLSFNYPHNEPELDAHKWFSQGNIKTQVAGGKYEAGFEEKLREMCTRIDSLKGMAVIRTTPPMLRFLTQEMKQRNLKPHIGMITVVGNILEPGIRDMASSHFACPVIGTYGAREFTGIGYECQDDRESYHIFLDRVIVEIVDEQGNPLPDGVEGNITVTCLDNTDMPLIRYQPGDVGTIRTANCTCKNYSRLLSISRRATEVIVQKDGSTVSAGYLLRYFSREPFVSIVRRFQIRNDAPGEVRILLEMLKSLPAEARAQLAGNVRAVYGDNLSFSIEPVEAIEDDGPKFKLFVGQNR